MTQSRWGSPPNPRVVALSGGVGGARLVHGLSRALAGDDLTVIVNTGDDFEHWGLHVSPDCDTVMYTLADLAPEDRGWGLADESFRTLEMVRRYGGDDWFQLGDRDLATHILRTQALRRGEPLGEVTDRLCRALGIGARIVPMADGPCRTMIDTVDQGLELLTGIPAGKLDGNGNYPAGTLNYRIAARLDAFAAKAVELARAASPLGLRA